MLYYQLFDVYLGLTDNLNEELSTEDGSLTNFSEVGHDVMF